MPLCHWSRVAKCAQLANARVSWVRARKQERTVRRTRRALGAQRRREHTSGRAQGHEGATRRAALREASDSGISDLTWHMAAAPGGRPAGGGTATQRPLHKTSASVSASTKHTSARLTSDCVSHASLTVCSATGLTDAQKTSELFEDYCRKEKGIRGRAGKAADATWARRARAGTRWARLRPSPRRSRAPDARATRAAPAPPTAEAFG